MTELYVNQETGEFVGEEYMDPETGEIMRKNNDLDRETIDYIRKPPYVVKCFYTDTDGIDKINEEINAKAVRELRSLSGRPEVVEKKRNLLKKSIADSKDKLRKSNKCKKCERPINMLYGKFVFNCCFSVGCNFCITTIKDKGICPCCNAATKIYRITKSRDDGYEHRLRELMVKIPRYKTIMFLSYNANSEEPERNVEFKISGDLGRGCRIPKTRDEMDGVTKGVIGNKLNGFLMNFIMFNAVDVPFTDYIIVNGNLTKNLCDRLCDIQRKSGKTKIYHFRCVS